MFVQPSIKILGSGSVLTMRPWRWPRRIRRCQLGPGPRGTWWECWDQKGWGALEVSNAQNSHYIHMITNHQNESWIEKKWIYLDHHHLVTPFFTVESHFPIIDPKKFPGIFVSSPRCLATRWWVPVWQPRLLGRPMRLPSAGCPCGGLGNDGSDGSDPVIQIYPLVMTNSSPFAMENPNHQWRFRSLGYD